MKHDYFQHKAHVYDQDAKTVDNIDAIANTLRNAVTLSDKMQIMDFGSGTGLLLERIAPYVSQITAVDVSPSMNTQLQAKQETLACELEILAMDLSREPLDRQFDGIISSMTLHHIEDVAAMFRRFYALTKVGGFIAMADLDTEDGGFHSEDTGYFHLGFDRDEIMAMARAAGFTRVTTETACIYPRDKGDYPIFLLTGYK